MPRHRLLTVEVCHVPVSTCLAQGVLLHADRSRAAQSGLSTGERGDDCHLPVLCGADDFVSIAEFGRTKRKWLSKFFDLPPAFPPTIGSTRSSARCTEEKGHGRQERREHVVCRVPERLPDSVRWPALAAIGMVFSCVFRNGKEHLECRHYILSKYLTAKKFAQAVRDHWSIENRCHWQLDVTFQEDQCRIRKGNADANFGSLRRTALSLLKNNHSKKVGVKNKRLLAALDEDYLLEVLLG